MSAQWFYTKNDEKKGPVTDKELKDLASNGGISPTDSLWKEGMAEWKAAGTFKSLFASISFNNPPLPNLTVGTQPVSPKIPKIANAVGSITKESTENEEDKKYKPAIFLHEQYFGGQTKIGSNLKLLQTFTGKIIATLVSWVYILPILLSTLSSYQFVPFKHTEYAKIILRQSIKWEKIVPIFATWIIILLVFNLLGVLIIYLGPKDGANMIGAVIIPLGYVISNFIACQMTCGLDLGEIHKTQIVFEYGFPWKHKLLSGISEAPIGQQMEGVLMLCEAISKAEFSKWDQFTAHSANSSSLISRVVSVVPGIGS